MQDANGHCHSQREDAYPHWYTVWCMLARALKILLIASCQNLVKWKAMIVWAPGTPASTGGQATMRACS